MTTSQMTICVMAANDLNGISDASFNVDSNNLQGGFYLIWAAVNQTISVAAPNYQTAYVVNPGDVYLTYTGGWPQTY